MHLDEMISCFAEGILVIMILGSSNIYICIIVVIIFNIFKLIYNYAYHFCIHSYAFYVVCIIR